MELDGERSHNNRLSVDLPCSKKSLVRAREKMRKFAVEHGFEPLVEDIQLATQEAIKNVIQHACPADNNVHVDFTVLGDRLVVEVSDIGRGFDPEAVLNEAPSPMALHGRGLRLMEGLMDDVRIISDQEGTVVRMEKMRAAPGGA